VSQTPPDLIAEATKRAGLIWIAIAGQDRPRPAWHIWWAGTGRPGPGLPGAAYVVTGPGEQPLPGLARAGRVTVIVAGGQAAGGRVEWTAAVGRVEPGSGEWDEVIGPLVAGRLNAMLAEGETSPAQRWARSGAVFRLAPVLGDTAPEDTAPEDTALGDRASDDRAAPNYRTLLCAALLSVHPDRRLAGHRQRRHSPQASQPPVWRFLMHRSFRRVLAVAAAGGLCLAGPAAAVAGHLAVRQDRLRRQHDR
jgi:hypothetical protein